MHVLFSTAGESSPAHRLIAKLTPTDETVQVITLTKITWAKVVTLRLYDRKNSILSFREVEVYNGQLVGNISVKQIKNKTKQGHWIKNA